MLFWECVVGQGLGHGRLDQLGRLAEPHAVEPSDDLARLALSGGKVFLGIDGFEHQRHLTQLAGRQVAEHVALEVLQRCQRASGKNSAALSTRPMQASETISST